MRLLLIKIKYSFVLNKIKMKPTSLLFYFLLCTLVFSCGESAPEQKENPTETTSTETIEEPQHNALSEAEKAAGWELLFDGESMDKWRLFKQDTLAGWAIADGEMQALGTGGLNGRGSDIITKKTYENFELSLEWKISPKGNSGIFFNVVESDDLHAVYESGPEYQLIDDIGFPEKIEAWQMTAANYAMHTAPAAKPKKVGEFNHSKIKVKDGHVEHWLNGDKVVEYSLWTEEWKKKVSESKWKDYKAYGLAKSGHIALQDHGNQIWFRNIKVRNL